MREHDVWVAVEGAAIGWVEVDRDRVAALYVSPSCSRRGVGSVLLTFAETSIRSSGSYRRIDVQDGATGELFPAALWYPTRAAPAPLFLTGSLSACRLPAMLCRLIAFEMKLVAGEAAQDPATVGWPASQR